MTETDFFQYALLPLAIFVARACDVSLGTVRVILLGRGMRLLAPLLGFIEILIWLLAIGQIMQNLSNWACYLAYGAGFALGNYLGMRIEERLAVGYAMVRIIVPGDPTRLLRFLRKAGFRVTVIDGRGGQGPVLILFTVIRRRLLHRIERVIQRYNPRAFYTVEDVRFASAGEGTFPGVTPRRRRLIPRRKGK